MTAIQDPYPETLDDVPFNPPLLSVTTDTALVAAINRLATAIEQDTLARLHPVGSQPAQNAPQRAPTALAPLPPVQVVADKPACPYHGIEKVAPSTNGRGGFYCQSKAAPGQPANPKGYCTWHT